MTGLAPRPAGPLHFRGVLLPGDEERDIYVADGTLSFEPIPGAETVLNGGWIVPGLVDAHCHVGLSERGFDDGLVREHAESDRDAGVVTLRDCGSALDTRWMDDDEDMPHVIRAGRHIGRPKRYMPGMAVEIDPADFTAEVERQAKAGDGWVKIVGDWIDRGRGDLAPLWTREQLTAGMQRAHELGAKVTAHTFCEEAIPDLVESGIDCIEHGTGITDDIIATMAQRGTALVPTVINIANFPGFASAGAKYPTYAAHMLALHESMPTRIRNAYEAGVPIYAGTDAGGSIAHGTIGKEIQALHGVGLSAFDALGAASWRAREWLGVRGVEEGAAANFSCYAGNPLEDLGVLDDPAYVVLRGRIY